MVCLVWGGWCAWSGGVSGLGGGVSGPGGCVPGPGGLPQCLGDTTPPDQAHHPPCEQNDKQV